MVEVIVVGAGPVGRVLASRLDPHPDRAVRPSPIASGDVVGGQALRNLGVD